MTDENKSDCSNERLLGSLGGSDDFPGIKVGDWLYLDTEKYLGHGVDDIEGGMARVKSKMGNYVEFEGFENSHYNLKHLMPIQEALKQRFGRQKAFRDPDNRLEFNDWA